MNRLDFAAGSSPFQGYERRDLGSGRGPRREEVGQRAQSRFRRLVLAQTPLEEPSFAFIGRRLERSRVASGRFCSGSDAAEQIGTRGMLQVIAVCASLASAGW